MFKFYREDLEWIRVGGESKFCDQISLKFISVFVKFGNWKISQ